MTKYTCKYCGKIIATDFITDRLNATSRMIDHLILRHKDKIAELGSIYLNDIPKKCYIAEVIENSGGTKTETP